MNLKRLLAGVLTPLLCVLLTQSVFAQDKVITGKVTDSKDGSAVAGATVQPKGSRKGTSTNTDGSFSISVPADVKTLVISFVGFGKQEVDITDKTSVDIALVAAADNSLNEVVVVGYGTARKKDLTGAVSSVKAKDFNQGVQIAPEQLLQGKVSGLLVVNNSGQPGGQTTVRIRGNSSVRTGGQPLYVIDGVPIDGRSARPDINVTGLGSSPESNPLNFINPNDIASMDVLKDASATAIYGSRGANGVIMVNLKKGTSGAAKIDFSTSVGVSTILKQLKVLDAATFRQALATYKINPTNNDWGASVDAMKAITRTAPVQNHHISISGGNESFRYRASFGSQNTQGIVLKSGLKRYTSNIIGNAKFLESKKLGLDFNLNGYQLIEQAAPITTNAGFEGSLIGMALQWNPTRALRKPNDSLNIEGPNYPATAFNPLAMSESYEDESKTSGVLATISPYFKFTDELEYRMTYSINYGSGIRRQQTANWMNLQGVKGIGSAVYANNELTTKLINHTLNFNKEVSDALNVSATLGYEYIKFDLKGIGIGARNFTSNSIPYTNYLQGSDPASREIGSFANPESELQSFFGRTTFNLKDKYLITATLRADGSSKFGANNRYGYFPSLAAAWNISNEDFMKNNTLFDNLKLRVGWGVTGNQEFDAGAAQERYAYTGPGQIALVNIANPNLRWESSRTANIGIDFSILKNKINGSLEYFNKNTSDLLFNFDAIPPAPASKYWTNLSGNVINAGVELSLNADIIQKKNILVNLGINASYIKNTLQNYTGPTVLTGAINGQGLTGASAQQFINGKPLNAFFIGKYTGLDKDGKATYEGDPNFQKFYFGSPNPTTLLGFSASATIKKLSISTNFIGAFGHYIYNNTTQAALAISNIKGNRNIAQSVFNASTPEDAGNSQPVSNRYLEKADNLRLGNMTFSYKVGNIGNTIKNLNLFLTGQNLFVITRYSGFDPEVNTPKAIGNVPSFGIEYTPYPAARTFIFGINFSL
jgi:iron complex outermembrane receptor protein